MSSGSAGTKENPVGTVPLDGFLTGELNSAQGDAREKRKALVGRSEALAARINFRGNILSALSLLAAAAAVTVALAFGASGRLPVCHATLRRKD